MSEHAAAQQRLTQAARPLRILVENSEYWLRNNGDLAMLAVTLDRMHQRWPDARIAVLTDSPCLLRAYFPHAEGISVFDEDPWAPPTRLERLAGHLGPRIVGPVALARLRLRVRRKQLPDRLRAGRRKLLRLILRRPAPADVPASETAPLPTGPLHPGSAAAAAQSSLVVALGGGYLTDADRTQTVRVLNLVEHACDAGVPVALVGQGLGPLDDPRLQARAAQVLPKVGLIALREGRQGPQILDRAGVAAERVLVTGDDAIELAYHARIDEIGSDIGFCLRVAGYAPVSAGVADLIGRGGAFRSSRAHSSARPVDHRRVPFPGSAVDPAARSRLRRRDRPPAPVCAPDRDRPSSSTLPGCRDRRLPSRRLRALPGHTRGGAYVLGLLRRQVPRA